MIAEPAKPKAAEPDRNPHAGAAAASPPSPAPTMYGPKAVQVERTAAPKDALDEAAELFRIVFKGDLIP